MKKKLKLKFQKRIKDLSSIDILGIFAIFFITATIYFFFSRKTEYLNITIRLFNQDAPEYVLDSNQPKAWYIDQIITGKAQRNQLGETLIEITDVYSYPNGYLYNDVYVTLKIKAVQNKITKQYIYEGSPLLIHDVKSFKIQDLLLSGEIIDIHNQTRELKKFKVVFKLFPKRIGDGFVNNSDSMIYGIDNYVAELIKEDLAISDSEGTELVKINKIEKSPGKRVLTTNNGLISIHDPDRTQVILYTDVLAEKINNHYYYRKEEPLMVDEQIWLTFEKVTVPGTIISIEGI